MKKNMGAADRVIRIVVGVVLIALFAMGKVSGVLAIVLGIVGAVMVLTALVGFCPAYVPLKMSTCKSPGAAPPKA